MINKKITDKTDYNYFGEVERKQITDVPCSKR